MPEKQPGPRAEPAEMRAGPLSLRGCLGEPGSPFCPRPGPSPRPRVIGLGSRPWLSALSRTSSSSEQPYLAHCDSGERSGPAPSTSTPGGGERQQDTGHKPLASAVERDPSLEHRNARNSQKQRIFGTPEKPGMEKQETRPGQVHPRETDGPNWGQGRCRNQRAIWIFLFSF